MPTDPIVTVLTAVRNGAPFLAQTIESIRAQTMPDWEYVIVDDASDDHTPDIARSYGSEDRRIRLIRRTEPGGPYAAANDGLRAARGMYVARIDADDLAVPHRIESQLGYLSSHPELRACASYWQIVSELGDVEPDVRTIPTSPAVIPWFLCVKSGFIHSSAFVERSALEEFCLYRELPVSQDYRLWCQLSRRRWLGVVPEALVRWRKHATSIGARRYEHQVESHIEILRDHLSELTGRPWGQEEATSLFQVSRARRLPILAGLEMLDRWEGAWRKAPDLGDDERRQLARLSLRLRLRHLRENGTREPLQLLSGLARTARAALARPSKRRFFSRV